jgi:hypothetical protein
VARGAGTPFEWFEIDRRERLIGLSVCVGPPVMEAASPERAEALRTVRAVLVSKFIIREIPLTN